jgi:hypothetical protein
MHVMGIVVRAFESSVATASAAEYAAASIELYSRLWQELEQLANRLAQIDASHTPSTADPVVTFRLELVVLIDACNSLRWQSLLGADQCLDLQSTLESVRRVLAVPPDSLWPGAIAQAQNQLLDAVLRQYNATLNGASRPAPHTAPSGAYPRNVSMASG